MTARIPGAAGLVAGMIVGVACSGSPSAPPPPPGPPQFPAGTAFMVTSGETEAPVAAASFLIRATSPTGVFQHTYVTDGAGRVVLDRPVLHAPAPEVDISAAGFQFRETYIRSAETRGFTLWPLTSPTGLTEAFTKAINYTAARCPFNEALGTGGRQLFRHKPSTTSVTVMLAEGLRTPEDIQKHTEAISRLNDALAGRIVYQLATEPPEAGVVVDARAGGPGCGDGNAGYASLAFDADGIFRATVSYCIANYTITTVLHELGHTLGLQHSPSVSDTMFCQRGVSQFSARERLTMKLMLQRPLRNVWPDNDRQFVPATVAFESAPAPVTFQCSVQ